MNLKVTVSRLDIIYRKLLLAKFFTKGWGLPEHLRRLFSFRKLISNRDTCYTLVPKNYPITITKQVNKVDYRVIEGKFRSPLEIYLPGLVPPEVHDAYFEMVLPLKWSGTDYKPICIHLAGTGDHYFWRRRNIMAKPLLKAGIGAIILENPFYGLRKPKDQLRSSLHYVSDIFVMGGCLILECIALLNWCEDLGFGPLGVTGISMGGHMASLAATNWPKPLVLVPCLSWSTASSVFTEGVMSESIDWDLLQDQYFSNELYYNQLSKLCKVVDEPFACSLTPNLSDISIDVLEELVEELKKNYITPYEILNIVNGATNWQNVDCKQLRSRSHVTNQEFSILNNFVMEMLRENLIGDNNKKKTKKESLWFMRGMMDECTHLKNFSVPYDTSLIISICAKADGYVPRNGISNLEEIWPGATVKYVDCGHVGAYIWYRKLFRESIIEAFSKAANKPTS